MNRELTLRLATIDQQMSKFKEQVSEAKSARKCELGQLKNDIKCINLFQLKKQASVR